MYISILQYFPYASKYCLFIHSFGVPTLPIFAYTLQNIDEPHLGVEIRTIFFCSSLVRKSGTLFKSENKSNHISLVVLILIHVFLIKLGATVV